MSPEELDKLLAERIKLLIPNQETASRLVNLVASKRPTGSSRGSHYPYYKKVYAMWIKFYVDDMLTSRNDILFDYDTFCNPTDGLSPQSLYLKINQSIRYLVDAMDTDRVYMSWQDITETKKVPGVGIRISFLPEFRKVENQMKIKYVEPQEDEPVWRRKLDAWLEGDSDEPFIQENLTLTEEKVVELKKELGQLSGIACSIDHRSVKVIRML